ncbi:hypothetical protein BCEP4_150007 [Burkholderia cepacia]|nr:hypothetical protein BCEP4_150007 [Burkholderia cepacia]
MDCVNRRRRLRGGGRGGAAEAAFGTPYRLRRLKKGAAGIIRAPAARRFAAHRSHAARPSHAAYVRLRPSRPRPPPRS